MRLSEFQRKRNARARSLRSLPIEERREKAVGLANRLEKESECTEDKEEKTMEVPSSGKVDVSDSDAVGVAPEEGNNHDLDLSQYSYGPTIEAEADPRKDELQHLVPERITFKPKNGIPEALGEAAEIAEEQNSEVLVRVDQRLISISVEEK